MTLMMKLMATMTKTVAMTLMMIVMKRGCDVRNDVIHDNGGIDNADHYHDSDDDEDHVGDVLLGMPRVHALIFFQFTLMNLASGRTSRELRKEPNCSGCLLTTYE